MSIPAVSPPSAPLAPVPPSRPPSGPPESAGPSPLAERLKAARKAAHLSQAEVAAKLGVHIMSVSSWERGVKVPKDAQLERLAELYEVSPAGLRYADDAAPARVVRETPRVTAGETGLPNAVRVFLQAELLDYVRAGVPDDALREARGLLESPEVHTFFRGGARVNRSEAAILKGMRALARAVIRPQLIDEGYKLSAEPTDAA